MINFIYKIYFTLPNFDFLGKFGRGINRSLGLAGKQILDRTIPAKFLKSHNAEGPGINTKPREEQYIISLTSFPGRINDVWIGIECLLRQSFKPDKIILWLALDQFPDRIIPDSLRKLESRGLEVKFCEEDLRAHKKYFYSLHLYPDANIITVDDDAYIDENMLENLHALHIKFPNHIVANRAHKMKFFKDSSLKPYRKWKHNFSKESASHLLFATGVGGVLYPPNSLHSEIFNKTVFKEICFLADDIWLKCMALKNDTKLVTNSRYNKDLLTIKDSQMEKLVSENVLLGGNDKQLLDVCAYYNIDLSSYKKE